MTKAMPPEAERLLKEALQHVPFDGWSDVTLTEAARALGLDLAVARALFPRGGIDLAAAYEQMLDRAMIEALAQRDLSALRMREKVALALLLRLEAAQREALRRALSLYALPIYAADGLRALWATADAVWSALGDTAIDGNWYSKRAILAGVHAATQLYWLGDESPGYEATRSFLNRRIEDVMRFEQLKTEVQKDPLLRVLFAGPLMTMAVLRKPGTGGPAWSEACQPFRTADTPSPRHPSPMGAAP